jgi:hypothetical protein
MAKWRFEENIAELNNKPVERTLGYVSTNGYVLQPIKQ